VETPAQRCSMSVRGVCPDGVDVIVAPSWGSGQSVTEFW
jgi:hypothetical protein